MFYTVMHKIAESNGGGIYHVIILSDLEVKPVCVAARLKHLMVSCINGVLLIIPLMRNSFPEKVVCVQCVCVCVCVCVCAWGFGWVFEWVDGCVLLVGAFFWWAGGFVLLVGGRKKVRYEKISGYLKQWVLENNLEDGDISEIWFGTKKYIRNQK